MTIRCSFLALTVVLCGACGSTSATQTDPANQTSDTQTADTQTSGGEQTGRSRALSTWNAELERLRTDPIFSASYDARAAELEARTPTAAQCEELAVLEARANERPCDPSGPLPCARPSDIAPASSTEPVFDHECPVPPDAQGADGVPSEVGSRLEGCWAAWTTWLFARCPG